MTETYIRELRLKTFTMFLEWRETDGTLDDCFKDIYSENLNFRRRWVDSLGEIVSYIELIQAHDPTLEIYVSRTWSESPYQRVGMIGVKGSIKFLIYLGN